MAITQYGKYMEPASTKGKIAEYPDTRADSFPAASPVEYGLAVELTGADNDQAQPFQGGKPHGVALAREYYDYVDENYNLSYKKHDDVPVIRKGVVWVEVVEDVSVGDQAFADNSTGNFRASSGTDAGVEMPGAVFKSAANNGELAKLEINLP